MYGNIWSQGLSAAEVGMDGSTFGELLRAARQRALHTLESLAEASGVSVRAISDMERGRSLPRQATLGELMDALELGEDQRRLLLQAAARRSHQVPQQLPPDLAAFRGREEVLKAVLASTDQVAADGGHVVVSAIGGMAGVGKTALAVHWAHQVADRFPHGQLYVNLRGFEHPGTPVDPGEALGGFLRALGVPSSDIPPGTDERSALFRERTASARLIVVLDNARNAEQIRPLLPASRGCLTIITSRNQLSGLAAAEGASLVSLDVWTEAEALAALAARIGAERCRREPEGAAELVALCGYLPLAVAVVGVQLGAEPLMPLRLAVRELREARPRLDALATEDQRVDVRVVFSRSYQALTPGTARFFRYLSVHPGPAVSAHAAASLAGVDLAQARRHLRELTSASLLSRDAHGRYVLHDLVRAYGTELVEQEDDDGLAAEARLLDYLRHNACTVNRLIGQDPYQLPDDPVPGVVHVAIDSREEGLAWYRQEEATATAALRSLESPELVRHRIDVTLEWVSWTMVAGRWSEEITATRRALDGSLALDDPVAIVRSCHNLARALVETGRPDDADEPLDLMLGQLHRLTPQQQARAERNMGWFRSRQGRHEDALRHTRRALVIARSLGHREEIGRVLTHESWCLALLGRHDEAMARSEETLPVLRELGDQRNEAAVWDTIGYVRQRMGDLHAAVAGYRKALDIFVELHDDYMQAEVLDNLASAELELGATEDARASWARAADLFGALRVARAAEMRAKAEALPQPQARPQLQPESEPEPEPEPPER
ncbi:Tfp pilus assembly protein PilF [Actinacidiphila yanglinensis]|uniref:Tfp pilus assembly protein PilF n=2 Tax=Actinacidiphila yanglinensis TaxID=310779 RepID=A0A1H6E3Y8_9ACTN|nr:Tfp pilus assembly protein PilF [Actinacidiphila yanglinensis]